MTCDFLIKLQVTLIDKIYKLKVRVTIFIFLLSNKYSMPPGIIQLQATGTEDAFLSQNPQINVFKYNYYRYANFAVEPQILTLNDNVTFGKKTYVQILKYGHLLSKLYLHIKLPVLTPKSGTYACWSDNIGHAIFSDPIELEIGGVIVDKIYPQFLDMWDELTNGSRNLGKNLMTLKGDFYSANKYNASKNVDLLIPLDFWFTKQYNMALPLVAINSQQIKINFSFRNFNDCINYDGIIPPDPVSVLTSNVIAEYVFLDDIVLKTFNESQTYLINQVQYYGDETIQPNLPVYNTTLKFNKPVKELVMTLVDQRNYDSNNYYVYSNSDNDNPLLTDMTLLLDGKRRFDNMPEFYYRSIVPDSIHSNIPLKYIYCIPFSIRPEDNQPTGHINIDNFNDAVLQLSLPSNNPITRLYVYAVCYNTVVIEGGFLKMS